MKPAGADPVTVVTGDLVVQRVDAIVNAANTALAAGSGVCGAILRAGGPSIFDEAATLGGCATGDAVATGAGTLPCRVLVHAVGPVWGGGDHDEDALLARAHRRAVEVAAQRDCAVIAFPAISTGVYGFPVERAAPIAVDAARTAALATGGVVREVRFVLFDEATRAVFHRAAFG